MLALVVALVAPVMALADDGIPPEVLADLKAATVFVKVKYGRVQGSGSGFLMMANKDTALIVTNNHVVEPPPGFKGLNQEIDVVFHSGRRNETVVPAEVVAADAERDLAILRARKVQNLPKPIDLSQKFKLMETMPIYMLGFPFGAALSTTEGNPAATIGKGTISSLRENDRGEISVIQIDGDLNPGNSGGPVVDGKGRLVGISVAKIRGTHIGLVIPARHLSELLLGQVTEVSVRTVRVANGEAEVEIQLHLMDPLNKIQKAAVRVLDAQRFAGPEPRDKDGWPLPLPGAQEFELKVGNQEAWATIKLKSPEKRGSFFVQPVFTHVDNTVHYAPAGEPHPIGFAATISGGKKEPKALPTPAPSAAGSIAAGSAQEVGDLKVRSIVIGSGVAPACLCWAADAKSFYHLDGAGVVRRISYPDFKEEAALNTVKKGTWLSLSSLGLVVTVSGPQEAWLLDGNSLTITKRIPIGIAKRAVSAPGSSLACASESGVVSAAVHVIDLKSGTTVGQYKHSDFEVRGGVRFDNPALSPDGKYLFTTGGTQQMMRFKINGQELAFEEASEQLLQGRFEGLCLSPGGTLVCAPSANGNYRKEKGKNTFSVNVFSTTNIKQPVFPLQVGANPIAVGFDSKASLIYGQNNENGLIIFDGNGVRLKEYKLDPKSQTEEVHQFLVHPEGRRLLILGGTSGAGSKIWSVVLPAK
jgi:hypothetical protein